MEKQLCCIPHSTEPLFPFPTFFTTALGLRLEVDPFYAVFRVPGIAVLQNSVQFQAFSSSAQCATISQWYYRQYTVQDVC